MPTDPVRHLVCLLADLVLIREECGQQGCAKSLPSTSFPQLTGGSSRSSREVLEHGCAGLARLPQQPHILKYRVPGAELLHFCWFGDRAATPGLKRELSVQMHPVLTRDLSSGGATCPLPPGRLRSTLPQAVLRNPHNSSVQGDLLHRGQDRTAS